MGYFSAGRQGKGRGASRLGTLELKTSRLQSDTCKRKERGKIFLFHEIAVNGKRIGTEHGTVETSSEQPDQRTS